MPDELAAAAERWARELLTKDKHGVTWLKGWSLLEVTHVEPGAICFVAQHKDGSRQAQTALVKDHAKHPKVHEVVPGWPVLA